MVALALLGGVVLMAAVAGVVAILGVAFEQAHVDDDGGDGSDGDW